MAEEEGTILVTGATGAVGAAIVRRLVGTGRQVRVIVRAHSDAQHLEAQGVPIIRGDIRDEVAVDNAVRGTKTIIHCAALFRAGGLPDQEYRSVHVDGTRILLESSKRHDVARFVHCSTIGVHGSVRDIPSDEDSPFQPHDIYQQTKLEGEVVVQDAIAEGFPAVIVRPAGVYGPGDLRHLKLLRLLKQGRFIMFGGGTACWHPVFLEDLVDGFILAHDHSDALGRTFILAGPRWVPLRQWIDEAARSVSSPPPRIRLPYAPLLAASVACEAICKPFGIEPPLHRRRASFFVNNRAFSIDRARSVLGYYPKVDIAEGLDRTATWYRAEGYL